MGLFDFFGPKKTPEQLRNEGRQLRDAGDRKKALELLTIAAEKYNDAESMYLIGSIYARKTDDGLFDIKKAFRWWEKAAENGIIHANCSMALRLFWGEVGIKQNQKKAVSLLLEEHPNDFSIEEIKKYGLTYVPGILGTAYSDGTGVKQDAYKSRKYLEMGHQLGDPICTSALAFVYYFGYNNFLQDQEKGVRFALKALDKPCPYNSGLEPLGAYLVLADAHSIGNFVDKDIDKSMEFCKKLDRLGHPLAKAMMDNLKNYM